MAVIEIESSDLETIKRIKEFIASEFGSKVLIKEKENKNGRWANFADSMSGLTSSNITEHISKSSQELRDSFSIRDLGVDK